MTQIGTNGDIGNGIVQAVVKQCRAKGDAIGRPQINARLNTAQLLDRQCGIGAGGDGEYGEGPVKFVQRGQAKAGIGRRAQGNAIARREKRTNSGACFPSCPVGKIVVANDRAICAAFGKKAVAYCPAVGAQATGQRQCAQIPVIFRKHTKGRGVAACVAARGH